MRAPDRARLHPPRPLRRCWPTGRADRRLFAAVERSDDAAPLPGGLGARALLVGPEGGFTPAELDALRAHPFVTPVSLGPRILRAETACIAGPGVVAGGGLPLIP